MNVTTLADLTDDGDILELDDGRVLRLRIEPDQVRSVFDDGDYYGRLAWVERRRYEDYIGGHADRPDGFNGNAEILSGHEFDRVWWQPPVDVKRGTDDFDNLRRALIDVLSWGYVGIIVELCEGVDAYGRPIVRDTASLWGIESMADAEYRREVVAELVAELGVSQSA